MYKNVINKKIDYTYTYNDLYERLCLIYEYQTNTFKVNVGFGFILYNINTEEFEYFYCSTNNLLFQHAVTIKNFKDLSNFMNKIINLDLPTNYYLKKPSSGWVLAGLTNVQIQVYHLPDTLIGNKSGYLPDYIKNSKSIISLTHNRGIPYKDNKCFFRCLALHKGQHQDNLEISTNDLITTVENHTGRSFKDGVLINHIPTLEVFFEVAVNIYSLQEDGSCEVVYLSQLSYKPMYINLYENHFSYISKINSYSNRYQCMMCESIFTRSNHLKRHAETCCNEIQEFYKGGKLRPAETLFDWLEKEGINVPEHDRYYKFFSVFDFEAVLEKREENVKGRNIKSRHVPASFSLCSNIPDHTKAIHEVSDGDSQELVDKMVLHQLTHQRAASRIMREKFKYVIDQFQREIYDIENENPELSKMKFFDKDHSVCKRHNKIKSLHASLLKYCDQLPILGFNSQKYDIPLIRRYLPSSLARLDTIPDFVIKKTNSYMAVSTKKLKYLDLTNYLAAGTSLDSFYRI